MALCFLASMRMRTDLSRRERMCVPCTRRPPHTRGGPGAQAAGGQQAALQGEAARRFVKTEKLRAFPGHLVLAYLARVLGAVHNLMPASSNRGCQAQSENVHTKGFPWRPRTFFLAGAGAGMCISGAGRVERGSLLPQSVGCPLRWDARSWAGVMLPDSRHMGCRCWRFWRPHLML